MIVINEKLRILSIAYFAEFLLIVKEKLLEFVIINVLNIIAYIEEFKIFMITQAFESLFFLTWITVIFVKRTKK